MEKIRSFDDIKTEVQDLHIDPHEVRKCGDNIENLVFEGGGIRGIAFGGAARFIQAALCAPVQPVVRAFSGL